MSSSSSSDYKQLEGGGRQALNNSYSDDNDKIDFGPSSYVNDTNDYKNQDDGPSTFCLCTSIENGQKIIELLEILYAVLQLWNIQFAPRLSITLFLLINLPLNVSWYMSYKSKNEGSINMAYRYNTIFKSLYLLRLIATMIGGIVFLVLATNHNGPVDYFCTRYYDVDHHDLEQAAEGHDEEVDDCREEIRTAGWIFYFPLIIFQVHCLMVMNKFRETIENTTYKN